MRATFAPHADRAVSFALKVYLLCFSSLWGIAVLISCVRGFIFHSPYPFNTFLFIPAARFTDFSVYVPRFLAWSHGSETFFTLPGYPFDYPAPLLVSELAFFKFTSAPMAAYLMVVLAFAMAFAVFTAVIIRNSARKENTLLAMAAAASTAIFSFPLMYLIDRGNIEGLVWIASSFGLLLLVRRRYTSAALFLGVAAAMKIFPGALLLLLLARRRSRDFVIALVSVAAVTAGSLWIAGPSLPVVARHIAAGLNYLRKDQVLDYKTIVIGFDHSLFAFIKQVVFRLVHDVGTVQTLLPKIYPVYGLCAAALFAIVYAAGIRRMPFLNQFLALSALSVLLPFVSYDYTLVHMYAPFALLILVLCKDAATGRIPLSRTQMLMLLLPFAVIFSPQSYLVHSVTGFGAQVKACALLAIAGGSLAIRLPSSMFNELPERETVLLDLQLVSLELQPAKREFV
jgi:Glycosyltransferase family 87